MSALDGWILLLYVIGLFVIGGIFGGRIKTSRDLFVAGGESPWWVAGLSSFMTMFSAGTFVVWGGIGYKYGAVVISISLCYGIAALLVGYRIAGEWNRLGVSTAAEFIEKRFGKSALQFYTWTTLLYKLTGVAVALYSVAVLLSALVALPNLPFLTEPDSSQLALQWAILLFGVIIIVYTVVGGLWAVLMTDVLQFIVLSVTVLFVVPLILQHPAVGGLSQFISQAPEGFLRPTSGEFTWFFLLGWVAIHVFIIGAEWAFVQRFLCVPSPRAARKASGLFGLLYLVSPVIWMLPPIVYRTINPAANPEDAYILACQEVLPPGVLGLLMAAMFSATASMIDSQLNVFSGVLTQDFYKNLFRPDAGEKELVRVGRGFTVLLGIVLIVLSLAIPHLGGAEQVTLSVASLLVVPLLAPTVWGLFSSRITQRAVWTTAGISFACGMMVKFVFKANGPLAAFPWLEPAIDWISTHARVSEQIAGVWLPIAILVILQRRNIKPDSRWILLHSRPATPVQEQRATASSLPAKIVAWNLLAIGILFAALSIWDHQVQGLLFGFAAVFAGTGATILALSRGKTHQPDNEHT